MKNDKDYVYIGIIIVLAIVVMYLAATKTGAVIADDKDKAVMNVKNVYSLLTGNNSIEILNVFDESGIYRVVMSVPLQNGQKVVQEVYITKDGNLITDRVVNATTYISQLTREKQFAECLASNNVVVVGQATEQNTQAQLQVLGSFAGRIFFDCTTNMQVCQNLGVTQVPTSFIGNQSIVGVQPLSVFENGTGCKLNG